jgi:hypothetical protein
VKQLVGVQRRERDPIILGHHARIARCIGSQDRHQSVALRARSFAASLQSGIYCPASTETAGHLESGRRHPAIIDRLQFRGLRAAGWQRPVLHFRHAIDEYTFRKPL